MAVTLTQEQIKEVALGLTRNSEFRSLYKKYRNSFPNSVYYPSAKQSAVEYIHTLILSNYPSSTSDDAKAILSEYDNTYGQDFLYNLLPTQIHAFDPDDILKGLFRAVADFRSFFIDLTKGLPSLHNPFECPEELLGWLGSFVGVEVPYDLPTQLKRLKIARAIPWYKIKGTHDSFRIVLRSIGFDAEVTELWSDYQGTQYSDTPDVYPVLPDGSPNPAYDPDNTTDGLIKYKTSYFDIVLGMVVNSLPQDVIYDILDAIEEVRPITRTLREIAIGKFLEDEFELPDDELDGLLAVTNLKDKYPFSSIVGPNCIDYSCGSPDFAWYDNLSGFVFDGTIDYGTQSPSCNIFYNNAQEAFFDSVLITDYSGLTDSFGEPFQFSGVYEVTLDYGQCSEKDDLDIDAVMSDEDDFWEGAGYLNYDRLDVFFDGVVELYYDNLPGAFDDLVASAVYEVEETVSVSDDADFVILDEDSDAFLDAITYDGEYGYAIDCHTYGEADVAMYDGEYDYDGAIPFSMTADETFDGTLGWDYDCNPDLYFDNQPYLPDELEIAFSAIEPEDNFDLPDDEISFELESESDDSFSLPSDELNVGIVEDLFDHFANPFIYDGTLSYGGTAPLFGGYALFYDGSSTFGSFGTYGGSPDVYDGTLTYSGSPHNFGGDTPYEDDIDMVVSSDMEDSISYADELDMSLGRNLEDTVAPITDAGEIDLESELYDIFYADVIYYNGDHDFNTTLTYGAGPVSDDVDILVEHVVEDSLPTSEEFESNCVAEFPETVSVSDEVEQVISIEDEGDPFGEVYLFGDTDLTYSSANNMVLGGDTYNVQATYNGFTLPVYDELEIVQESALIDNWDTGTDTWDQPGDKWDT